MRNGFTSQGIVLVAAALLCLFLMVGRESAVAAGSKIPATGPRTATLQSLDIGMKQILTRWQIPGASLAIARKGKLIYSRGFGYANVEKQEPVQPDSMFRIASISKSITAVAALKLIESGKLKLTDRVFELLPEYKPCSGVAPDKRLRDITVRDLLQCSAGWESKTGGEPLFGDELLNASAACGTAAPPELDTVIRYWLARPLTFAPNSRFGYSNFTYALLGEVVARASGRSYEDYVLAEVLKPAALKHTLPGKTKDTAPGEVRYYPTGAEPLLADRTNPQGPAVPWEYGGDFVTELLSASAGWISSAPDLVRLTSLLAGLREPAILSKSSVSVMLERPKMACWNDKKGYFAMGWEVYETDSGKMFSRVGGISGSSAYVVYRPDGTCWSVLFNARSADPEALMKETKALVWRSIKECSALPLTDLF